MLDAQERMKRCTLCPRACEARRLDGETGECGGGLWARVASAGPHFGEESPLVGFGGSGTIFFSNCPLKCVFCQNWEISQEGSGRDAGAGDLAGMMLGLQRAGCHNINVVTPTHVVPHILEGLYLACEAGLRIPIVYNSGGYDSVDTLELLDGVVDIYMPDFKYADAAAAKRYSNVDDYPRVAKAALREMHRQVGDLELDDSGIAVRGMIVRHLVLPGAIAGTGAVLAFIAGELSPDTYVNVMDQYRPAYRADRFEALARRITRAEFDEAIAAARAAGLNRLDAR